ncbi:MAG: ASKHA domain-containing protein [Thermoleophilia bacterium]
MSDKKMHTVIFQPSGRRGQVEEGESVLQAARELGVEIEAICGEKRTCGKCKVRIEDGFFERYGIESSADHVSKWRPVEEKFINEERREEGYRLSCVAKVEGDLVVFVPEESRAGQQVVRKAATDRRIDVNPSIHTYYIEMPKPTLHDPLGDYERLVNQLQADHGIEKRPRIDYQVLRTMPDVLRKAQWKVSVSIWDGDEVPEIVKITPGKVDRSLGLAVDVGTTTVAAYLCDLSTGEVLNTDSMMNPQVPYGEDVMSRITYAMSHPEDGIQKLQKAIIEGINTLAARITEAVGHTHEDILEMAIVFNTAMHHCFLGIYPEHLGLAPYAPALHHSTNIKARDLNLNFAPGANVFVMPNEAGFVGADNVGVLIAEAPYNQDDKVLIIDIGTNGELIMGNRKKLISSSCATGPALEGAHIKYGMRAAPGAIEKIFINPENKEPRYRVIGKEAWSDEMPPEEIGAKGICGSGIIDAIAELFKAGIIDKTGKFRKDVAEHPRVRKGEDGDEYVLAWANETSIGRDIVITIKDVRAVQLAKGALYAGAKIMMEKLGYETLDKVILAGAFGSYIDREESLVIGMFPDVPVGKAYAVGNAAGDGARMALLDKKKRVEADEWARKVEYIELSVEPKFEKEFMMAMHLPHMKDKFPNLAEVLAGEGHGDLVKA